MNFKSTTTATITKTNISTDCYQAPSSVQHNDDTKNFKEELAAVKKAEDSETQQKTAENTAKTADEKAAADKSASVQKQKETQKETELQQQKDAKNKESISDAKSKETLFNQLFQLKTEISNVKEVKNGSASRSQLKDGDEIKTAMNFQTIKMDHNDALFFANMIKNQQFGIQNNPDGTSALKAEGTQKTYPVSATLMDSLSESMKTNKPFRIDFDKDISVIMKVDKQGKISAEFIPGDKAVEAYLKNNISTLQQSFDEQNLPYNSLSYQEHKKDREDSQQNSNNRKNKENDDE